MVRRSRTARRRDRQHWVGGSILLLIVLLVVAASVWWWTQRQAAPNPQTLCPAQGPRGHVVLLVDRTDPFNRAQKVAFDNLVRDVVERQLPPGYLLSVFMLADDFDRQTLPLVELCNPGDARGHNELTENLRQIDRTYREKFLTPLREGSERMVDAAPAQVSPVLEMLQMVSLQAFERHRVDGPRELIMVSDLLQHGPQFSFYRNPPSYEAFELTPFAQKTRVAFEGVDVRVALLLHQPALQQEPLKRFWQTYFERAGARSVRITPLPG